MGLQAVIGIERGTVEEVSLPGLHRGHRPGEVREGKKQQRVQPGGFPTSIAIRRFRAQSVLLEAHQLEGAAWLVFGKSEGPVPMNLFTGPSSASSNTSFG